MSQFDGSHDFQHVERVVSLALEIHKHDSFNTDPFIIEMSAYLHDVGDAKYAKSNQTPLEIIKEFLTSRFGPKGSYGTNLLNANTIHSLSMICSHISYSKEMKMDPKEYESVLNAFPEIRIVQDADRLDAIGAIGIARTFCFGGHRNASLKTTLDHFDDKLLKIQDKMKTIRGKQLGIEKTRRLVLFKEWMHEECSFQF